MPNEMTAGEAAQNTAKKLYERASNPNVARLVFINDKELEFLRRVASGELAEVVHAHWIIKGTHAICSNCKGESRDAYEGDCDYCKDCGALMDGFDMRQTQNGKDDSHV